MQPLPKRKKIRLPDYDYSQNGCYFVTVCTKDKACILSSVGADSIRPQLTGYGELVHAAILEISNRYTNITVDHYVIMPNHIHLLLSIRELEDGRLITAPAARI